MSVIALHAGTSSLKVSTVGGCIMAFEDEGTPLMRGAADDAAPIDSACYPLVPFGNRVRDNRFVFQGQSHELHANTDWDPHYLHGEGWRSEWTIAESTAEELTISHEHDGSALPYRYRAQQQFRLVSGELSISLAVTNTGTAAMPFGIGWHPYFPMTPKTTLQTRSQLMWTEEPGWLPGERVPLSEEFDFSSPRGLPRHWVNNAFEGWNGEATINWPERHKSLQIKADPLFTTMFLFVSDVSFDTSYRRDFFALEPMSHLPNAHNLQNLGGLKVLQPGDQLKGGVRCTVKSL